jgi:small subunit ribosomal protein S16
MLVIRFFRTGKKHQPSFKIVVTDRRNPPKGGRFVDEVGFWNPLTKENNLKVEKIKYWISKGAKPSDSAYNLFIREKVLEGKKVDVCKKSKKKKEGEGAEKAKAEEVKTETAAVEPEKSEEPAKKPEEKIAEKTEEKTEKTEKEEKPEEEPKKEEGKAEVTEEKKEAGAKEETKKKEIKEEVN